jgi:hypothetical protein
MCASSDVSNLTIKGVSFSQNVQKALFFFIPASRAARPRIGRRREQHLEKPLACRLGLQKAELELGGLGHHAAVPRGIEDDLDLGVGHVWDRPDLGLRLDR